MMKSINCYQTCPQVQMAPKNLVNVISYLY